MLVVAEGCLTKTKTVQNQFETSLIKNNTASHAAGDRDAVIKYAITTPFYC